ncbi:MAG: saccharopine dehydrogenase [Polaromonas sp.]|nr:saccharopine dehydrogenase [Polaromonas sp.]
MAIDLHAPDLPGRLAQAGIGLLLHTAGPFQQQDYGVAAAAAAAGAHYIDLADGRRFVADFEASMDAGCRQAGTVAISGASSVPALSSAVVDALARGWTRIDSIDTCIAPAQTAPRGRATLAAVLAYCGMPVRFWSGGRWQSGPGWGTPEEVTFARLRPRLGALCDVPDLELFPARYGVTDRVTFKAALEVAFTQRVFAWLASARARGLIASPEKLAGAMVMAAPALDFLGSGLGGMVVRVAGCDGEGAPRRRAWHLTAANDTGPEIPCMATLLLARRLVSGEALPAGARACTGLLKLEEFQTEFARWGMSTDTVEESPTHGTSAA